MLPDLQRRQLADQLYKALRQRCYIPPVTETHPDCEIADAYAIAQLVSEAKVASGNVVKGHKIGLTSKAMLDFSGATEPDYGAIFDEDFIPEGSEVRKSRFNRGVGVEIEIAFALSRELCGPRVTAADVIRATDFALAAIEIVDSRYNKPSSGRIVVDSVADGAWCGGIVLGGHPRRLDQIDIGNINGSLVINGELRASGLSSAVMGNPLNAVAWLANKLAEFRVGLEPGHVVMSGSFISMFRLREGDDVHAIFDEFGEVSFSMIP